MGVVGLHLIGTVIHIYQIRPVLPNVSTVDPLLPSCTHASSPCPPNHQSDATAVSKALTEKGHDNFTLPSASVSKMAFCILSACSLSPIC